MTCPSPFTLRDIVIMLLGLNKEIADARAEMARCRRDDNELGMMQARADLLRLNAMIDNLNNQRQKIEQWVEGLPLPPPGSKTKI